MGRSNCWRMFVVY